MGEGGYQNLKSQITHLKFFRRFSSAPGAEDFYTIPGDLNIDIGDAVGLIYNDTDYADTEAEALGTALMAAIVDEWHDEGTVPEDSSNIYATGLSIHHIPMDSDGYPVPHNEAYVRDITPPVEYPLAFVQNST